MLLQTLNALAHRAMGDVHLLRSMGEIQVPGSRFEEAKCLERGKRARHEEMAPAPTAGVEALAAAGSTRKPARGMSLFLSA